LKNNSSFTFTYNGKSCSTLMIERTLLLRCMYELYDDSSISSECQVLVDQDFQHHLTTTHAIDSTNITAKDTYVLDVPTNWIPLCYKYQSYEKCTTSSQ